jgi:hypothetical protein
VSLKEIFRRGSLRPSDKFAVAAAGGIFASDWKLPLKYMPIFKSVFLLRKFLNLLKYKNFFNINVYNFLFYYFFLLIWLTLLLINLIVSIKKINIPVRLLLVESPPPADASLLLLPLGFLKGIAA